MLKIISVGLYILVGIISLIMAGKGLLAKKYLPFHEKAAATPWADIDKPLQLVILLLLKISGMGFLITALLLLIFPIVDFFMPHLFYRYAGPVMAMIFCSGLLITNFSLYRRTKAETPWKGSLYAILLIGLGIVLSLLAE